MLELWCFRAPFDSLGLYFGALWACFDSLRWHIFHHTHSGALQVHCGALWTHSDALLTHSGALWARSGALRASFDPLHSQKFSNSKKDEANLSGLQKHTFDQNFVDLLQKLRQLRCKKPRTWVTPLRDPNATMKKGTSSLRSEVN